MIVIMPGIDELFAVPDAVPHDFAKGGCLFHQNDPVRMVYRLCSGAVQLRRQQAAGGFVVLQRALAGDILAEASLFAEHYHCDAVAVAAGRLWAVPARALRARLAATPADAWAVAGHLAREVQRARFRAELLGLRTVGERLDAWLAWQQGRLPERGSWALLAGELGVTPEALYRALAKRRRSRQAERQPPEAC